MTSKAMRGLFDKGSSDGRGFFLQVESASIDKQDHVAQACGQIGKTVNFDRAVKVVLDYAKKHGTRS